MMRTLGYAVVGLALLGTSNLTVAAISGPTQSSGQFSLTWTSVDPTPGDGSFAYLLDVSTGVEYDVSPVSFGKPNGIYEFRETVCLELWSSVNCYVVDTHTVTVSGSTPPTPGAAHVIKRGDIDGNGLLDYAVVAPVAANRAVDDFILVNTGGGNLAVLISPTSTQLTAARAWTTLSTEVGVADLNGDTKLDVTVFDVGGLDDFVIWSSDTQPHNFPTRVLRVDSEVQEFMSELAASLADPNYYANATTTVVVPTSDWYVVTVLLDVGGYYYDENGVFRFFPPGFHTILVYFLAGETIEVTNTSVVVNYEAYVLKEILDDIFDGSLGSVIDGVAQILIILEEVLNTDIGVPGVRGPYPNDDDARGGLGVSIQVLTEFCDNLPYVCNAPGESGNAIGAVTICASQLSSGDLWKIADPGSYKMPEVPAPSGTNFVPTTSQRITSATSTDAARLSFWQSRLSVSKDPVAPLAIDVVNDEYALGCIANRRYETFRDRFGGTASLTAIGSELMREHVVESDADAAATVSLAGKLGVRQVADYHHRVFNQEGLPPRTFGGTPITGNRNEARMLQRVFCPSCDSD